jgi:predicted permease
MVMSLLRSVAGGLRSLFRKAQVCQELDEELDGFLEMAAEEKMKQGMSRKDALRAVRLERGSLEVAKEVVWSAHWESVVDTLWQDFRFALRMLRKSPGFAAASILTLALGIGINTAIFSLLNALIRPLNVPEPDRLVRVFSGRFGTSYEMSYPNYVDLRGSAQSFSELAVYSFPQPMSLGVTHSGEATSERVWGIVASGNYFQTLGVSAALGRTFAPDEDRTPDSRPVVVISHRLWRERFNGDPNIVGLTVKLNGYPFEVIGVAPDRMLRGGLLLSNDLWLPMMMEGEAMPGQSFKLTSRNETFLNVIGRLRPSVSLTQSRAEAKTLADRMERGHPKENHQFGLSVLTEREGRTPFLPGLERFGWILLAIVGLVLLIACANVAGLVLLRALGRRRELGIRMSLGAGRWRLVRQLITEGMILSSCGGLFGLGIAAFAIRTLLKFAPPVPLEISLDPSLDHRVLMFTLGASLATGILFSTLPAFRSTKLDVTRMLKAGDASLGESRTRMMGRDALVVGQIAVSLLLLIMGGLFVRSLEKAQQINSGFDPTNRLLASADTFLARYSDEQSRAFDARLLEEVGSTPGVIDVSSTAFAPLSGGYLGDGHVYIEGETPVPDYDRPKVFYDRVGASFFRTMGTPLLAGRDFTDRDVNGSSQVVVVNQTFADTFWPGQNPIGKRLKLNSSDSPWIEVVGLVPTGKYLSFGEAPQRHIFLAGHSSGLVIHTASDPHQYMQAIRAAVQRLDPNLAVASVETMNEHLGFAFYPARMSAFLLGLFSMLGLSLAMLGLYGLLAFVVRQRTHEVGIRIALGARKHDVLSVVMRQGILLVALGMTLGLSAAYAASRVVAGLLYGIGGRDFFTFTEASFLLAFVALLAMYIPASRAARVDPMIALRYE